MDTENKFSDAKRKFLLNQNHSTYKVEFIDGVLRIKLDVPENIENSENIDENSEISEISEINILKLLKSIFNFYSMNIFFQILIPFILFILDIHIIKYLFDKKDFVWYVSNIIILSVPFIVFFCACCVHTIPNPIIELLHNLYLLVKIFYYKSIKIEEYYLHNITTNAFIYSAPQIIFHSGIIIINGYYYKSQLIIIFINFCLLVNNSTNLFFSQRLGRYSDTNPHWKLKLLIMPLIGIQLFGNLSTYIIFTAYQKSAVILLCLLLILFNFIYVFKIFFFNKFKEQKKIFIFAALRSWLIPTCILSKKTRFYLISNFITTICLMCSLIFLIIFHSNVRFNLQSAPITHCLTIYDEREVANRYRLVYPPNNFIFSNFKHCNSDYCKKAVIVCNENENHLFRFYKCLGSLSFFFILSYVVVPIILYYLRDYENIYKLMKKFKVCFIHLTFIQNILNDTNPNSKMIRLNLINEAFVYDHQIFNKILFDPQTQNGFGKTCISICQQNGNLEELNLMYDLMK